MPALPAHQRAAEPGLRPLGDARQRHVCNRRPRERQKRRRAPRAQDHRPQRIAGRAPRARHDYPRSEDAPADQLAPKHLPHPRLLLLQEPLSYDPRSVQRRHALRPHSETAALHGGGRALRLRANERGRRPLPLPRRRPSRREARERHVRRARGHAPRRQAQTMRLWFIDDISRPRPPAQGGHARLRRAGDPHGGRGAPLRPRGRHVVAGLRALRHAVGLHAVLRQFHERGPREDVPRGVPDGRRGVEGHVRRREGSDLRAARRRPGQALHGGRRRGGAVALFGPALPRRPHLPL
mmetsp:Transcript_5846/g.18321  ORF Transcript_5846/g.18321 Transcript_5846/m.18321 type:complete len:295 (+) Transcript_5846:1718-2602(+)